MKTYSLVNDENGTENIVELDEEDAASSRIFWKKLGWTLFERPNGDAYAATPANEEILCRA